MPTEKDHLAAEVAERWVDFHVGLSNKRCYPLPAFRAFVAVARRYAELTQRDSLIRRSVASAINGLTSFLRVEM